MLLSLQKKDKKKHTHTHKQTKKQAIKQKQKQHIVAPVYITDGDAIRQLL